jgi:hypothetical protein
MRTQVKTSTLLALGIAGALATALPMMAEPLDNIPSERAAGCDAFRWTVANERAWFTGKNLRQSASGVRLSRIDRAVELTLKHTKSIQFFLPPMKAPDPDSYSGEVTFFGVPRPGVYQVTISQDAAVDVFENGRRLVALAMSEAKGCEGVRKSERFALAPGDLVLIQVSGATEPLIKVAFAEADLDADKRHAAALHN